MRGPKLSLGRGTPASTHVILAKVAVAGIVDLLDHLRRLELPHCYQARLRMGLNGVKRGAGPRLAQRNSMLGSSTGDHRMWLTATARPATEDAASTRAMTPARAAAAILPGRA